MTETARALESTVSAWLDVAFELGSTTWMLACTTAGAIQRPRLRQIAARDLAGLEREFALAKVKLGLPADAPVRSCYEAGRDGFWLHRWLTGRGVRNVVVDSSSIEVNRRARRAKTDWLDAGRLLALLRRWAGGEPRVWSVVHVPTPEAEAARQLTREIATVRADRAAVRNRIQGLLATQGIRGALTRRFAERLRDLTTRGWSGRCRAGLHASRRRASGRICRRSPRAPAALVDPRGRQTVTGGREGPSAASPSTCVGCAAWERRARAC